MAIELVQNSAIQQTLVVTGYEGGLTAVHLLIKNESSTIEMAQLVYLSQPHTQPILSLSVSPDAKTYFTSGADAVVAAHRIPNSSPTSEHNIPTQHTNDNVDDPPVSIPLEDSQSAPQTATSTPDVDGVIDAALDDPPISIPDDTSTEPISFSKLPIPASAPLKQSGDNVGGLSSLMADATAPSNNSKARPPPPPPVPSIQAPFKINNTKHAGQQSLSVRSDGRLLATGGWDSRIRIYSTKTLKEVAVLKWHKEGVYAVAFAVIIEGSNSEYSADQKDSVETVGEVVKKDTGLSKLQRQREEKMQVKHWIAAGAKDGKVSLWEIF